jgi:pimeloyl-ACP methyl ester carboxylesterase
MQTSTVTTRFADIAIAESDGLGPAVLLLHGNSSAKEIFREQLESPLGSESRLIAMDLPGHGASSDAHEPNTGYALAGYAACAAEVLNKLGVAEAVVFGWSLGGHIAMDMIGKFPGLVGVMISGTPPVPGTPAGLSLGFRPSLDMALASQKQWSETEAEAFARAAIGRNAMFEPFMLEAARRADPRSREVFFAGVFAGQAGDQRRQAETDRTPLAIVNGAEDPFINHGYFDTVRYANLWDGRVHRLSGLGHAPFWEAPEQFNSLLERFVAETSP